MECGWWKALILKKVFLMIFLLNFLDVDILDEKIIILKVV